MRRMLAERSKELLARYRRGDAAGEDCPQKNALETASSLGCETVAVPLLGGGLAMYPERPCADVMVRALRDYRRGFPDSAVKVVWLVGRMENELDALEAALDAAPELRAARDDSPNATALPT